MGKGSQDQSVIYHFHQVPFPCLYDFPFHPFHFYFTKSLSFHSILTSFCFCSYFTFYSILLLFFISIPYYFLFLFYFHSSFLSLVAQYWYHKHCLSSITLNHVLLIHLDNLSTYILPIPHIIFTPLIHLSVPLSI